MTYSDGISYFLRIGKILWIYKFFLEIRSNYFSQWEEDHFVVWKNISLFHARK